MILVLLGTQDKPFTRLIETIDNLIVKKLIKEEVIAQLGFTKYKSKNIKGFDLIPSDELNKLIKKADLIITHGGVGSILSAVQMNKKVIAVPRLALYKEHTNDHQIQIVDEFAKTGYNLKADNPSDIEQDLKKVKAFKPKKYVSNNAQFIKLIEEYIDSL